MTLADLAAVLGLAVLAVVYVGFRLGEKGGCPNCGGPGACAAPSAEECSRPEDEMAAGRPGEGTTGTTSEAPPPPGGRGR